MQIEPVAGRNAPRALTLARLRLNTSLATYRLNLAAAQFLLALERRAGFDPDQPRVPAGNSDGGEWTEGNGGGVGVSVDDEDVQIGVSTHEPQWRPYFPDKYDLDPVIEERRGGHTIRRHGPTRTDQSLKEGVLNSKKRITLPRLEITTVVPAEGAFDSEGDMRFFLNEAVNNNIDKVHEFLRGKTPRLIFVERFGYATGREAYLESNESKTSYIRRTFAVRVVLIKDSAVRNGFYVRTVYPMNEESNRKALPNAARYQTWPIPVTGDFSSICWPAISGQR